MFEETQFIVDNHTQFIIIPDGEEEIRATFDVFWKQNNVYLLANYQAGEEVDVTVTSGMGKKKKLEL